MTKDYTLPTAQQIQSSVRILEDRPAFMLAADLADFYGTETRNIGQAIKRNPDRFPEDFCFRLTELEAVQLKSQNVTSMMANRDVPLGFTEAGALALSGVLKTERAAQVSVLVYRAFVAMREDISKLQDQLATSHTHLLAQYPRWAKLVTLIKGGASEYLVYKRSNMPQAQFEAELKEIERCGLLDPAAMHTSNTETLLEERDRLRIEGIFLQSRIEQLEGAHHG